MSNEKKTANFTLPASKKIWLSIASLLVGYFVVAVTGIFLGRLADNQIAKITDDRLPVSRHGYTALLEFKDQITLYEGAITTGEVPLIKSADDSARKVRNDLQSIADLTGDRVIKESILLTIDRLNEFTTRAATVYPLMINAEMDRMDPDTIDQVILLSQKIEVILEDLNSFNEHFSSELTNDLTAISNLTRYNQYIGAIVAAISILMAVFISIKATGELTERLETEENLKKSRDSAEAAARLKGEFLANMSHEIRTPINGIMGMTEIALGNRLGKDVKTIFETIYHESGSLLNIVNQILDFSKLEAGKFSLECIHFNLRTTFENACGSLAMGVKGKDIEFISFLSPDIPVHLVGDPGRLTQVWVNLAGNAMKFTHAGEIFIQGELVSESQTQVELRFIVKDTGIGIAQEKQTSIFESFRQEDGSTTRKYGGTGLGTTISKELVELMGGEIGLESEKDLGSTFWFTVNLQKQQKPDIESKYPTDFHGLTILVVENNKTNQDVFSKYLKSIGITPVIAQTQKDAMGLLEHGWQNNALVDLIFINFKITGLNGIELVGKIKDDKRISHIPIVSMTSITEIGEANQWEDIGIAAHLLKPLKKNELQITISEVLNLQGANTEEKKEQVTSHSITGARMNRGRILVAEDYPTNQKVVKGLLTREGFDITLAQNGKIAVALFKNNEFDLIFMDIQMPEMDGYEATKRIRAYEASGFSPAKDASVLNPASKGVPIVAMTAHAIEGYREKCLESGMDDYTTKPIKKNTLVAVVNKWIMGLKQGGLKRLSEHNQTLHQDVYETQVEKENRIQPLDEPMDYETALKEFENDAEFLNEVIDEFLETVQEQFAKIKAAILENDFKTIREEAHAIKGGAANLIALPLSAISHKLEKIGKSETMDDCDSTFNTMRQEFFRLKTFFEALKT